jgi:carbonic anhydrase
MASTHSDGPAITTDEALRRLMDGNKRFLRGEARFPTVRKEVLAELARKQTPYATVVGCSDSRVPPELLFDAGFGELFVIRVAGNTLSPEVAGSMQYAAVHLKTPLFVILGHEGCGAVSAALETKFQGVQHHSRIAKLVQGIVPALDEIDPKSPPAKRMRDAVEANVRWTVQQVRETPEGRARAAEGIMKVVGAVCQIKTGRIRLL